MSLFGADPFPLLLLLPWDQIKESGNAVEKEIDGLGATKGGRDMHLTADLRHFWICHLNAELDFNEMTKLNSEISMQLIREMMFSNPRIVKIPL